MQIIKFNINKRKTLNVIRNINFGCLLSDLIDNDERIADVRSVEKLY